MVNRDKKGDPAGRAPIEMIDADQQRRALKIVLDNSMHDDAFGLSPELLRHMTVDRWFDGRSMSMTDETWPVHSRISGIQASALTQLLNPTTINRVYDNEFRADPGQDVVTVPEVMAEVHQAVWSELNDDPSRMHDARNPYISSLRRNLQREHLERLIDMSMPSNGFRAASVPVRDLSRMQLSELRNQLPDFMIANEGNLDAYTNAHLQETMAMIDRAMDAQYIYNANDMGGGGTITIALPFEPVEESTD